MTAAEMLEEIRHRALQEEELRHVLLATRTDAEPLTAFCRKCRELGYPLYEIEVITAGEEFHAAMKRSTNGGGENSPMLEGQNDFYELFFVDLEKREKKV